MNTRSTIQQILENNALKEDFVSALDNILEKYMIEDAVFSNHANNLSGMFRQELINGYFISESEHKSLKEAVAASSDKDIVIRVINNEKFECGKFYERLSDCPHDHKILDIQTLHYVNE